MTDTSPLLRVEDVSKTYDGSKYALEKTSFTLSRGEFVSIIGCSGAGKSTLLRCINSLVEPTGGTVEFDGHDMGTLRGRALRQARRRISMVFQHYNLVYRSSVIQNVLQGRLGYKSTLAGALSFFSEEDKRLAFRMLDHVGLSDYAYTRADQLSGGQKQRVGIARALVQEPLLILADEPIASLDPKSSKAVMELLRWAADELGIACLVSLHQVDFALEYSDRIIGLAKGRKVFEGLPSEATPEVVAEIYEAGDEGEDALEIPVLQAARTEERSV